MKNLKSAQMRESVRKLKNTNEYVQSTWRHTHHHLFGRNGQPRELLILSAPGNAHGLCAPFHCYRRQLCQTLGLEFQEVIDNTLSGKRRSIERFNGEFIFFFPPLRDTAGKWISREEVRAFLETLPRKPGQKLVLFDVADGPIGRHFDCAPFADLYAMAYTFADPANYTRTFLGGNMFADFVAGHYGLEPTTENEYWPGLMDSQFAQDQLQKLFTCHRIGYRKSLVQLYSTQARKPLIPQQQRSIDVHCRFQPYGGWCRVHRFHVRDLLHELAPRFHIIATENKVPYREYCAEVNDSKIVVSPFGWGEFCPKDWEAFIMGALLIKPSVEHLNHFPRLLVPNETYVPVKWDLSDLKETIVYYLEHEKERLRIVKNASATVKAFYEGNDFVDLVREILQRLGLQARRPGYSAAEHVSDQRALR